MSNIIHHADVRVTWAAEYLASARKTKPDQLPPSVMVREIAELRRQLGTLLDLIGSSALLGEADRAAVLAALADARAFREGRADAFCEDCDEMSPNGLCLMHADELDMAARYTDLARTLGGAR